MIKKTCRRIIPVLLTAAFLFTLSACAGKLTSYERFSTALEKLNAADSLSTKVHMNVSMVFAGVTLNYAIRQTQNVVFGDDNSGPQMSLIGETESPSTIIESEAYFKDGFFYMKMMDDKIRMEFSEADINKQIASQNTVTGLELSEDDVTIEAETTANGLTEIKMAVSGEALKDLLFGAVMNSPGMDMLLQEANFDISLSDVTITVTIDKDDNLKTIALSYDMTMVLTIMQTTREMRLSITSGTEILKVSGVMVEFPDDLDTYESADEQISSIS